MDTHRPDPERLVLQFLETPRPDLKDLIVVEYAGMVERIARRFSGIEPVEDLVQVGFIGLLNALSKFNPSNGVQFNTYATHLVAGEIKHYLRDRAQTIRHPAWLQELRHKVTKTSTAMHAQSGKPPSESELAEACGVSESTIRDVIQSGEMVKVSSLDASPGDGEDGETEVDRLVDLSQGSNPLSIEDKLVLEEALLQLRDLERDVLVMFHFEALNQTDIAHRLGISCNYVSHILRQSLSKLRRILTSEEQRERVLREESALSDRCVLDARTGVYTEEYLRSRLQEEVHRASAHEKVVSIILIEFQGLGKLKSFYGEASVRDFLSDAADFLKGSVRRLDIVARYGPAGFGIILPSTGPSVTVVRQRITQKFDTWLTGRLSPGGPLKALIGHACYPEHAVDTNTLILAAVPVDHDAEVPFGWAA